MKRIIKYFMLAIAACMITGCVNYNIEMIIDKSGKVELSGVYAISKSFAESKDDLNIDEATIRAKGFVIEDYETNDYIGIKIKKTYDDIDKISKDNAITVNIAELAGEDFNDSQLFQIKSNGLFKKTYKASFAFDLSSEINSNDFNDNNETDFNNETDLNDETDFNNETDLNDKFDTDFFNNISTSSMVLSYKVTLPDTANSSNADKIEGNTLTWNFSYGQAKLIEYEFDIVNTTLLYGFIGGGAIILLAVIAIVITSIIKKNKKNKTVTPVEETSVAPVTPVEEAPTVQQINPVAEIMNPTGESLIQKELLEEKPTEEKTLSQPLPTVEQILNQVNNSNNQQN